MIPNWLKQLGKTAEEHEKLSREAGRNRLHNLAYIHHMYAEQLKKEEKINNWWNNNVKSVLP